MNHTISLKIKYLEKIFSAFNEQNLSYAVVHGLEGYPQTCGRDLDIIMLPKDRQRALGLIKDTLKPFGFATIVDKRPFTWMIFCLSPFGKDQVVFEIDLMPYMNWGPAMLIEEPRPAYKIGPFAIDPWAAFAKRVFIQILGGNIEKFQTRKREELCIHDQERAVVEHGLQEFLGDATATQLIKWIDGKDIDALQKAWPGLRKKLARRTLVRKPLKSFAMAFTWLRNELALSLFAKKPAIPSIALVGPDGVGKSTVLDIVRKRLPEQFPFTKIHVKHWRPELLPPLKLLLKGKLKAPAHNGQPVAPRREAGKFRSFRLFYYFLDFWLGWHILDKPKQATLQLILYDRCALDMAVDPLRFGLSSGKGVRWLWRNSPHPDAVILLNDDPDRIYNRKPELTRVEIAEQLQRWMALYEEGAVSAVVQVDNEPEIISARIERLIIDTIFQLNNTDIPAAAEEYSAHPLLNGES